MFILFINLVSATGIYMDVEMLITDHNITVLGIELYEGSPQSYAIEYEDSYDVKVFSVKDEILEEFKVRRSFYVFDSPVGELDEVFESISFNYHYNVARMEILYEGELMLNLDLMDYNVCNEDFICDPFETEITCPHDCLIEEEIDPVVDIPEVISDVEEEVVDVPEVVPEVEPFEEEKVSLWLYIVIGVLILILIILIILIIKTKNK